MSDESTKVLHAVQTMTNCFNQQDINGVMAAYETGAAVIFEPGEKVSSTAALQQKFNEAFQINPKFDYPNGHEVYIANDIALHISPWQMIGKLPDGTELNEQGLSIAVLRKHQDGEWRMVLDNPHGHHLMASK